MGLLADPKCGQKLELNWYPEDSSNNVLYVPGEGSDHIGYQVDNVTDTFKGLVAEGKKPAIDRSTTESRLAYVKGSDGN